MYGNRLRKYRESLGLKVASFAERLGISQGTLSNLETEKTRPSADTIRSLYVHTNINLGWLLTGEGPMERTPKDSGEPDEYLLDKIQSSIIARKLFVRDMVSDYADSDKDQSLLWIILYLKQAWEKADPEERAWIKVQFRKAFPDFDESTIMNLAKSNDQGEQTNEEGSPQK